jgi:Putative prokaryotic signal transducing protein
MPPPEPLTCPKCAARYSLDERFCKDCGMPLTYAGRVGDEQPVTAQQERARRIKPEYTHGDLRHVVTARQQAEAEWIQMLLLEEGVPSTLRRTAGFDVPEMLAAGPRDVLVPDSGLEVARQLLHESEIGTGGPAEGTGGPAPLRLLAGIVAALGLVAGITLVLMDALK